MSATLEIPLFSSIPLFDIRTTLDGREFILSFDWNDREQRFYFSIAASDGTPIMSGRKLVCNWPLTRKIAGTAKPPGILMAIDYSNQAGEPPGLNDLGERVKLVYFSVT